MRLGKSQRDRNVTQVSSVAAFSRTGLILFGKRADNGLYSLPGGCANPSEDPRHTAVRELFEETNLRPVTMTQLGQQTVSKPHGDVQVTCFWALVDGAPSADNDPDQEFSEFFWFNPKNIPAEVLQNLHSDPNVTLTLLGIEHGEDTQAPPTVVPLTQNEIWADAARGRVARSG